MIKKVLELITKTKGVDEATKEFDDLSKATNRAADSADRLDATFEEVYGELQPLTTRMGEAEDRLYELALAGDTTSKEYNDLLKSVGNYRKVQIQTDLAVDAAATTLGQKLGGALTGATSGFAAVQGVMALTGSESEALEESLLKVQGALALQQGVQGVLDYTKSVGLASKAQKAFNLIVSLNPLAIFLTVITSIVASVLVFTDVLDQATQVFKDFADFIGMTNFEENKLASERKKRAEDEIERIKEERKERETAFNKRQSQFDREIAMLEAEGKSSFDLRQQKIEDSIAIQKEKIKELNLQLQGRKLITDALGDTALANTLKEGTKKLQEELLILNESILDSENQLAINTLNNNKKKTASYKEHVKEKKSADEKFKADAQKALDDEINEEIALQQALDKIQRENEDRFRTEQENETLLIEEKYDTLQAMAQGNAEALEEIEIARLNELNDINLDYAAKQKAIDDDVAENKKDKIEEDRLAVLEGIEKGLEMAEKGAAAVQALGDAVFAHKMQGLEKGSKEEEKMARKQFKFNKALQLGGAIIDAGKAITASLAQSPVAIGPVPNPAGIASLAFAAATSAANIATIASTKFESTGGTVDNPSPSGIGGGGAPEFNVVGDSSLNQLASLQQEPVQAFVVSGEVTTAQALDRNRVQNATL